MNSCPSLLFTRGHRAFPRDQDRLWILEVEGDMASRWISVRRSTRHVRWWLTGVHGFDGLERRPCGVRVMRACKSLLWPCGFFGGFFVFRARPLSVHSPLFRLHTLRIHESTTLSQATTTKNKNPQVYHVRSMILNPVENYSTDGYPGYEKVL